jgi:hypothetical protein
MKEKFDGYCHLLVNGKVFPLFYSWKPKWKSIEFDHMHKLQVN